MKNKTEIAVKITDKNRKKVKAILEMFSEVYGNGTFEASKEYPILYYSNKYHAWLVDTCSFLSKGINIIKTKKLKQILAREKLKAGDYIKTTCGDVRKFEFPVFDVLNFKRYATKEEIEEFEVDKFAELKEAHKNGAIIQVKYRKPSYQGKMLFHDINEDNESGLLWNESFEHRIKPDDKPKVGDVCKFWDNEDDNFIIGIYKEHTGRCHTHMAVGGEFDDAKALTQEEVIELLFKK